MCGICGFTGAGDSTLLKQMIDILRHRGPDDKGEYVDEGISLGHSRLSIIDILRGHQPLSNEDGSCHVICNGEIYNYKSIRKELEMNGHRFSTDSDTEVIIHAYEEYGPAFPNRLKGMFSIAIWDGKRKRLVLVRDRIGIKPMYYHLTQGGDLVFASEIKAILLHPLVMREVNESSMLYYLNFRFTPPTNTMFKAVYKLKPGHILMFENGKIEVTKYWDLEPAPILTDDESSISQSLKNILETSSRMRMMSDVPIGVMLSGGVDSSSIVAMLAKALDTTVETFSVGFNLPMDEFKYAQMVADEFHTNHHELTLSADIAKHLPEVIWHFDDHTLPVDAITLFLLSKRIKRYVTVILVGQGGDEIFAGYGRYRSMLRNQRYYSYYEKMPSPVQKIALRLDKRVKTISKLDSIDKIYERENFLFDWEESRAFTGFNNVPSESHRIVSDYLHIPDSRDTLHRVIHLDIDTYLPDGLLHTVDRMTMAHAVEARVPFLDEEMVKFANVIPTELLINGKVGKYILKRSMKNILPREVLDRQKMGLWGPMAQWWFEGNAREITEQLLGTSKIVGRFLEMERVNKLWNEIKREKTPGEKYMAGKNFIKLWSIVSLEAWYRVFIELEDIRKPPSLDKICSR